jgi:predicted NAD/FAD-dependent oxidoreductase
LGDPVIIVGAGLAGLGCARALAAAGVSVRVLERGRGVGGRCATRRVEGQPVDHGPSFLHGSDPRFLEAARAAGPARSWPLRVRGQGAPCHPDSFRAGETQLAHASGLSALPKSLARGLEVQLDCQVEKLERSASRFELTLASGAKVQSARVVVAAALEQTVALLKPLSLSLKPLRGTLSLLESMGSAATLALLVGYPRGALSLPWDIWYPEESQVLQLIAHDSQKRAGARPAFDVLVAQARPKWSRAHLDEAEDVWRGALLDETARLVGTAAARPSWTQAHRWRYARTYPGTELSAPILHRFGDGFLGLAGDAFALGGGAEGAFLSGAQLGERIINS